ncbi:hypothetical protein [Bizionia algoritergicola]|uniref:Oligosaccharide repeat unit polymerase n=1 Tax=Bizionia algoritergicola TaxID=291187 RepID=A0A5D0R0L7_9FLAO|nr:hypothetical protein [Bizionia algoritergicola]TYB75070.1 hypothetical protein ES675_02755 [Bizionia algoritergicola]
MIKKINLSLFIVTTCLFFSLILFQGVILCNINLNYKIFGQILIVINLLLFFRTFKKKIFEPYLFVPFITLLYGYLGGINFIKRGAYVDYVNELYFMLFVFCIMLSYTLLSFSTVKKEKTFVLSRLFTDSSAIIISKIIIVSGFLSILIDWIQIGGIPIFISSDARMESKPILRLVFLISIFFSYYNILLKANRKNIIILSLFIISAILSGYRTTIFFILLIVFFKVSKSRFFKVHFKKAIFLFLLMFFFLNLLKLYRDVNKYGMDHYRYIMYKEQLPQKYFLVSPILHTIKEGPQIFQQIRDQIGDNYGGGTYFLEHISTILPGKQRNYGQVYNNITKAITDNTKTGTILSPFYIDFGVLGICLLGIILGILNFYFNLKEKSSKYYNVILMFVISFEITWIHGGAPFSPTFILAFLFFIFMIPVFNRVKS